MLYYDKKKAGTLLKIIALEQFDPLISDNI